MATKKTATKKKASSSGEKKTSRCWPGYEPTPGKEPHSQGSCKPKAKSKKKAA